MAQGDADQERRGRARARRGKIAIVRARHDENGPEATIRGLAGIELAARLTRAAWALGGHPLPTYSREETPYAFIPNSERR